MDDLDFADDIVLLFFTRQQMQNITKRIDEESKRVGLKISMQKAKVMKVNAKNQEGITINGLDNIEEIEAFTYLGAKMCKEGGVKDLQNRLSKARGSFVRLKRFGTLKVSQERQG